VPHPAAPSAAPEREEARRRLGVAGPLVLFLGLVRRYKGVDLLLSAAPEIVRSSRASVAVVGEVFPDARDLARRAAASSVRDRIVWKDVSREEMALWRPDVVALVPPISGRHRGARLRRQAARSGGGGRRRRVREPGVGSSSPGRRRAGTLVRR
jgi:hypothetical protein